jgi:uncharacterized protein (TIGR00730 family)
MHESDLDTSNKFCRIDTELLRDQTPESPAVTSWRIFRIMAEMVAGFEILKRYGLAATVFGSARATEHSEVYGQARALGAKLAGAGYTIITGGGGGVMEAANRGAFENKGSSVGLNIKLPIEQHLNGYVTDSETFHFFFTRKVALAYASEAYIFFPGGFGTLDEFFEIITLIQTKKIACIPVVLVGRDYWEPLLGWLRHTVYEKYRAVGEDELTIYHVVDTAEEAFAFIESMVPHDTPKQ